MRSTWYFRWRTAQPAVIEELQERGAGRSASTTRRSHEGPARPGGGRPEVGLEAPRRRLREEIETFTAMFGPIRTLAAHGDTRVPGVRNGDLLRDEEWSDFGVDYDANDAMRRHALGAWLTDRSRPRVAGATTFDPFSLLAQRQSPILCLTHPNNWVSGAALWQDRLLALLPGRGSDRPPALP